MPDPAPQKFDEQNYWRYIFAPMFLIVIGFGLYILFTMNDSQSMSLNSVAKQVNSMSGSTHNLGGTSNLPFGNTRPGT